MAYGHRERLRERYTRSGMNGLQNYELVELLLTYTIPRKDCKEIAKQLIEKYGDIENFFHLGKEDFISNKYISERTYVLFRLIGDIIQKKLHSDAFNDRVRLSNNTHLIRYLRNTLGNEKIEIYPYNEYR